MALTFGRVAVGVADHSARSQVAGHAGCEDHPQPNLSNFTTGIQGKPVTTVARTIIDLSSSHRAVR